jgi:hypothetical protein
MSGRIELLARINIVGSYIERTYAIDVPWEIVRKKETNLNRMDTTTWIYQSHRNLTRQKNNSEKKRTR